MGSKIHMVIGLLIVAIAINVVSFYRIEANTTRDWTATNRPEGTDGNSVTTRYGHFTYLRDNAPNLILYASSKKPPKMAFQQRLFGLSRIKSLELKNYDPSQFLATIHTADLGDTELYRNTLTSTLRGTSRNFLIIGKKPPIRQMVLVRDPETDIFIDVRVLSGDQLKELHR